MIDAKTSERMENIQKEHPEWYHATDYHWLESEPTRRGKPLWGNGTIDTSDWNRLDDIHRRDMASWDGGDPDDYPYGEY